MAYVSELRNICYFSMSCNGATSDLRVQFAIGSLSPHFNVQFLSRYACGKWRDEHPIPDKSSTNSWFDERRERMYIRIRELLRENGTNSSEPWAVSQAKLLYSSCMNVRTLPFFNDFSFHL